MPRDDDAVDNRRVKAFGRRVRELRDRHGLTQERLAEDAGLHRAEVGFIERGEREIGITKAWRLADAMDCTLAELTEGVDRKVGGRGGRRRR